MLIYRISRTKRAKELTGEGARLNGGRWNSPGHSCLYAGENRALCALEYLVNNVLETAPWDLSMITIQIPDDGHLLLEAKELPEDWNNPIASEHTQRFGTALLEKMQHLIIRVPSAVIPQEYNYLINPSHPAMKKVSIEAVTPFSFDTRLRK